MKFKTGDKVQWTHEYRQGKYCTYSTRKGVVTRGHDAIAECCYVKHRGNEFAIHESRLRYENEPDELTEMVLGKEANKQGGK